MTSSSSFAERLRAIRKEENLTQKEFAELIGVHAGTIRNYETSQADAGLKVIEAVVNHPRFEKYTIWLMTEKAMPELGQISPTLSPDGSENTSKYQKAQKAG